MKDQEASTIVEVLLNNWIYRHGKPSVVVSDQAKNVNGEVVNAVCKKLGIDKRKSFPYHLEGNVQAERRVLSAKAIITLKGDSFRQLQGSQHTLKW